MAQLSTITINLNNSIATQSTITSADCLFFANFEFSFTDNDSFSNSVEIIKNTQKELHFSWENLIMVYTAKNIVVKQCANEYYFILNSVDFFSDNSIKFVFRQ